MRYRLKRIGQGLITYIAASTIAFTLFRMMPGGPVQALTRQRFVECQRSQTATSCSWEEIAEEVERQISIDADAPIPEAYVDYLADVMFRLDFGVSTQYQEPVFEILFNAMPWSLFISLFGLAMGLSFNIFWGAALAYKEGTYFDKGGTLFALGGNSVPYYVAAILALAYFAFTMGLFPTGGRYPDEMALVLPVFGEVWQATNIEPGYNLAFVVGVIWHGSLPIFTGFVLGISGLGMRGNSIRVLESDYLRVARLRGLGETRIANRYVARNAVLPLYTGLMIGIAGIFSSGIITERIFTYPAIGWYTFSALETRDYPLMMGAFLFYTGLTIMGILLADFSYKYVDPRAGGEDREAY